MKRSKQVQVVERPRYGLEAGEHIMDAVVLIAIFEFLRQPGIGAEEQLDIRALLALDLFAKIARALHNDPVEQLLGNAGWLRIGLLSTIGGGLFANLLLHG